MPKLMKSLAAICCAASCAFAALPEGATQLEYIQGKYDAANDKYVYLDTGWTLNPSNDVLEAVVEIVDNATGTFWCTRNASMNESCTLFNYGGTYFRVDYDSYKSELSRNIDLYQGIPYTVTVSNGTTTVSNGARVDIPVSSGFTNAPGHLLLFASCQYDSNGIAQNFGNYGTHRLRSFRIWRGGTLVRDFVPVRTTDNVVTLADAVEGGVLTPLGTGAFDAGDTRQIAVSPFSATVPPQLSRGGVPDARPALSVTDALTGAALLEGVDYTVDFERYGSEERGRAVITPTIGSDHARKPPLKVEYEILAAPPPGYTRLEYVQGDGRSYWITDYLPEPANDEIEVDFAFTEIETTGLFCARAAIRSQSWSYCFVKDGATVRRRFDYNAEQQDVATSRTFVPGERYRLSVANKEARMSDGELINIDVSAAELAKAGDSLVIFAYYSSGTGQNINSQSTQRLYRFKVRRSGKLIHDWVPVRTSEGVVTLYDLVEDRAIDPAGDGTFIAGPVVNKGVEIAPVPVQTLPAGGVCEPVPVVTQAGTGVRLVAGTDYAVSYSGNGQAGLATLTVTGVGAYAGAFAVTVPFNISPELPSGFTRLEYIQGNATAYLLTDWTVNFQTDRVESEMELTDVSTAAVIWCSRGNSAQDRSFTLFRLANNTFRCDSGNGGWATIGWDGLFPTGVKLSVVAHGKDFSVSGVRWRNTVDATLGDAGGPLMLFASYHGGSANNIQYKSRHRLYEFRVFRQGRLVRRWVPVRTPDGTVTLFDLMEGTSLAPLAGSFISGPDCAAFDISVADQAWDGERAVKPFVAATNRTTGVALEPGRDYTVVYENNAAEGWARAIATGVPGTIYAGQQAVADFRVIRALDNGYERLEYLAGDGITAMMTEYVPQPSNDTLTLDFALRDAVGAKGLICARGAVRTKSWSVCWEGILEKSFRFDSHTSQNTWPSETMSLAPDMRHTIKMSNNTVMAECASSVTAPSAVDTAGGAMVLLGYYSDSSVRVPNMCAAARIYGCQVVRSGTLIHDWVPVRTPEGVVTLYDRVEGGLLECVGKGALVAGPVWTHEGPVFVPKGTTIIFR